MSSCSNIYRSGQVTAATGLDVLAHCAEAITNRNYNAYANIVAKEGIRLTMKYLKTACEEPKNVEAREKMALAANLGGQAIAETAAPSATASVRPSVR